jgi:glucose-6-phosphate 1-dehydrogenase
MTSTPTDTGLDIVIFGGAGDLSFRKLLPALYMAHAHDKLSADTRILAVGRQSWSNDEYLQFIDQRSPEFIEASSFDAHSWQGFLKRLVYVSMDVTAAPAYAALKAVCEAPRLRVFS